MSFFIIINIKLHVSINREKHRTIQDSHTGCASVKDRSPRLAENNYAHPIARRATLTTRDNKGDEAKGGRAEIGGGRGEEGSGRHGH